VNVKRQDDKQFHIQLSPDATIAEALELMRKNNIRKAPAVKNGKLVGIVTEREILRFSPQRLPP